MRFKYYLRGVGLGILFSTIILMIAFHSHGSNISDDEVIQRAKELGMVWSEDEEDLIRDKSDSQIDVQIETEYEPESQVEAESQTETAPSETQQMNGSSDIQTQENESSVIITVVKGEVCRTLAEDLAAAGLIEDAEEFRKYMGSHNYADSIHVGEFEIPRGSTYEEIANILIN